MAADNRTSGRVHTLEGGAPAGRIARSRVVPGPGEIQRIIMRGGNAIEIAKQARIEAVRNLRQAGLYEPKQGLASLVGVIADTNE